MSLVYAWLLVIKIDHTPDSISYLTSPAMLKRAPMMFFLMLGLSCASCADSVPLTESTTMQVGDERDAPNQKADDPISKPEAPKDPFAWVNDTSCMQSTAANGNIGDDCCMGHQTMTTQACASGLVCIAAMGHQTPVCVKIDSPRSGGSVCKMDEMCDSMQCDFEAGDGETVGRCRADINEDCNENACADGLICILNGPRRIFKCWPEDFNGG